MKRICAHLNAFHVYASDPPVCVESNHYCSHVNDEVRQCLIYDAPTPNARLIGVEYMVSPRIYKSLDEEERKLWHSHIYEVKSGMLVMPKGTNLMPERLWEAAETKEMETVVGLYGKTYHFWRVERGDPVPLGPPQLMMAFTQEGQLDGKLLEERNERFGVDMERKKDLRKHIEEPVIHPGELVGMVDRLIDGERLLTARADADGVWKGSSGLGSKGEKLEKGQERA